MKMPEHYRVPNFVDPNFAAFLIPYQSFHLQVLASYDTAPNGIWEHVSVALPNRNPNWDEMCFVKDLFWDESDECIQFHPRKSDYVNFHKHCLHIWKPPVAIANMLDSLKQMA